MFWGWDVMGGCCELWELGINGQKGPYFMCYMSGWGPGLSTNTRDWHSLGNTQIYMEKTKWPQRRNNSNPMFVWTHWVIIDSLSPGRCGSNFKSILFNLLYRRVALTTKLLSAVWYKTKFGSQNVGYQLWFLFCNMWNIFTNMFNVGLKIMWQSIVVEGFPTIAICSFENLEGYQLW